MGCGELAQLVVGWLCVIGVQPCHQCRAASHTPCLLKSPLLQAPWPSLNSFKNIIRKGGQRRDILTQRIVLKQQDDAGGEASYLCEGTIRQRSIAVHKLSFCTSQLNILLLHVFVAD